MSDERLKKTTDTLRLPRAASEREATENREISDDERVEMFRQQFFQTHLPDLPQPPGWHLCWATTTNPRDSIHGRLRLGYQPVKPEDVPGWEYASLKTGEYAGFIGVNEMVALKLPESLYQKYMRVAHYEQPRAEEEKLAETARFLADQARAAGAEAIIEEGWANSGDNPRPMRFA